MKNKYGKLIVVAVGCLFLAGCGRIIDWVDDTFYQGVDVTQHVATARRYMRSVTIYDQLDTIGMFDVLWLSDQVREAYVSTKAAKYAKSSEQYQKLLKRQLEENHYSLVMYVLSLESMPLSLTKDTMWSISLRIGDTFYPPVEIEAIDLTPEYVLFFGEDKVNKFKTAYRVVFNARNAERMPLLHKGVGEFALHLRSVKKETMLLWKLDAHMHTKHQHRHYTYCSKPVSIYPPVYRPQEE